MKIVFVQTYGSGHPPLGLMYLASALEKGGFNNISIIDIRSDGKGASPIRKKEYLEGELRKKPDIVGLTSTTATINEIIDIGKIAKEYGSIVMLGGPHATIFQERVLEKIPFLDLVVYGEADNTICEILERIESAKSLEGINGVIYKENGNIKKNPPNPIIKNLDAIPFPARHLIDLDNYHAAFAILTSRGCPFKCTFCSRPVTGDKWRGRSPKNVVDEIESMLRDYPKIAEKLERNITISDECFNLNKKRAKEICDEIIRRKLDITFQCVNGFHPSAVDLELFEKLKKAGCKEIWFGIESGNEQILKRMKKGITKDKIKKAVEFAKKAEIETIGGHFIIGLEDETIETARDSIRFMKELNLNFAGFNQATPLPDTELWRYVETHGRFLFEYEDVVNYESFRMDNTRPQFETPEFSAEERIKAYEEAIKELDRILRRRMLAPKNILKHAKDIKSFKDVNWAANRVCNIIFGKDLRRQFQPKPRRKNV